MSREIKEPVTISPGKELYNAGGVVGTSRLTCRELAALNFCLRCPYMSGLTINGISIKCTGFTGITGIEELIAILMAKGIDSAQLYDLFKNGAAQNAACLKTKK